MRVVGLVDSPEHVCCRYRLRAFEREWGEHGWSLALDAIPRGMFARRRVLSRHGEADVVVLQRRLLDFFQWQVLRRRARRLVFDFDDAVLYRDSYSSKGPHSRRRLSRFRRTVAASDAVLAGNQFLAEQAARFAEHGRVSVVPTCVDPSRYAPATTPRDRPGLELVWIGSSSTLQGLQQFRDWIEMAGRAVPGLRLRIICDRSVPFGSVPVVTNLWSEQSEADCLAQADVGISFLPDDLWSRGKCGLKVLQYMAAGLPVLANPVGVQPEMVRHGETGWVAGNVKQWIDALQMLAADRDLCVTMGRRGRQVVEDHYSVTRWAPELRGLLAGCVSEVDSASAACRFVA